MSQAARNETESDDAIADDHDRGEHRVARQRVGGLASREHRQCDDQRHLDHRHRDREHERPEWLANAMRDDLRVMDGGEHRENEHRAEQHAKEQAERQYPVQGENEHRQQWNDREKRGQ